MKKKLIFSLLLLFAVLSQAQVRKLQYQTWYGDALGETSENVATKKIEYFYNKDNVLSRRIQTGLLADSSWVLTNYYLHHLDGEGRTTMTNSLQYGLYDQNYYAFQASNDTVDYEYNTQGLVAKDYTHATKSSSLYYYNEEGQLTKKEIYKKGTLYQTLEYSDFTVGGPQTVKATATASYNCYDGTITYDASGNKTSEKHYTTEGVLNHAEYWTYDETGFLTTYEKKGISSGKEVDASKTEYEKIDDLSSQSKTYSYYNGKWVFKGGSTCLSQDAEFDGNRYAATINDVSADNQKSEVKIRFTAPEGLSGATYRIYRNGIVVGMVNEGGTFTDEVVPNGSHEYYIQTVIDGVAKNISNVYSVEIQRTFPRPRNLHGVTAKQNTNGSYIVTMAWENPSITTDMNYVNTNIIKIGTYHSTPLLDEGYEVTNPKQTTADVDFGKDPVLKIFAQIRFQSGLSYSDTITVDATTLMGKVEETNRKLRTIETYGDAMGENTGITKKEIQFYGNDNRIHSIGKYAKDSIGTWLPYEYTVKLFAETGYPEKEYTRKYGRYDYGQMGYQEATDTTFFEYDVDGQLTKETNNEGSTTYEYSLDGSLTKKHIVLIDNEQTITYSNFYAKDKPCTTTSEGSLNSYKWTLETEYDSNGRKSGEKKYTWSTLYSELRASQYEKFVYDSNGELQSDSVFKITISGNNEKYTLNSVTTYETEAGNSNRVKVVKRVWDNILGKFGNPKTWNVYEYTDINATKYSPTLTVTSVEDKVNTVQLNVTVPKSLQSAMTAFNIYRDGIEIAHQLGYYDDPYYQTDEYGRNGKFVYEDESLKNGKHEYFVEYALLDASMENEAQVNNTSNIVWTTCDLQLPQPTGLKEVSRRQTTTANPDAGTTDVNIFVTLAWNEPQGKETYGFKRYNVMVDGAQIAENSDEEGTSNTYEIALRGRESVKAYIMAVYDYGYAYSDTLTIESVVPEPSKKGVMYLNTPADYQVLSISQNGEWACGFQYDESSETSYGFRWNLMTGKIEKLGVSEAYGVANDGTVTGAIATKEGYTDGKNHETAAAWKDGTWTALEIPSQSGSWTTSISPDGRYITGTDNNYTSYIWEDGKIKEKMTVETINPKADNAFLTYAISPDGTKAGGWAYYSSYNRNPGYWDTTDHKFHELEPNYPGSPWQTVRKFSLDSKKILFWGGYHVNPLEPEKGYGLHALYDTETQDTTYVYPLIETPYNFDLCDMNGDASVIVGYQQDLEGTELGIVWDNGETSYIEQYLKDKGADFSDKGIYELDDDNHYLFRTVAVSGDGKTFAVLYYDDDYDYHTMIVALDRDIEMTPPQNLAVTQMTRLKVASLEWDAPLGDTSTLMGYNIYRDGEKINLDLVEKTSYYDQLEENGTYSYSVSAEYMEGESAQSEAVSITIADATPNGPQELLVRSKGYNNTYACWNAPASNLAPCTYIDESKFLDGFGGGSVSFEGATLYPADQMNLYNGYKLTAVSFYPMSEQGSWIINVYTEEDSVLTTLGSFKVSQELNYGEKNTVYLSRQITLQPDHDLIIGIQTNVINSSYNVQGVFEDCLKVGYNDLLRVVGDDSFFSVNEMGGTTYDMAWGTTALLAPSGTKSDVDNVSYYNIYVDGLEIGRTEDTHFQSSNLIEGKHTLAVEAVYANETVSDKVTKSFTSTPNESALTAITPEVSVDGNIMTAEWAIPMDDDAKDMGYCTDVTGSKIPKTQSGVEEMMARVDFTPTELRGYDEYRVASFSFYPMTTANYAIDLYEGEDKIYSVEDIPVTPCEWATVIVPDEIILNPNKTYHYVIDCYNISAGEYPLGTDNGDTANDYSDLYMVSGDEEWGSISEFSATGNWMMRMGICDANAEPFEITSYEVYIDGTNTISQTTTDYTYEFSPFENESHDIRVDATYTISGTVIEGNSTFFDTEGTYTKGDVNCDGSIDIADVNAVLSVMYGSTAHAKLADVNWDGIVDIADVNAVLTIMFE